MSGYPSNPALRLNQIVPSILLVIHLYTPVISHIKCTKKPVTNNTINGFRVWDSIKTPMKYVVIPINAASIKRVMNCGFIIYNARFSLKY